MNAARHILVLTLCACSLLCAAEEVRPATSVRGRVRDVFLDDTDTEYCYVAVDCDGKTAYASCRSQSPKDISAEFQRYIGAEVVISGSLMKVDWKYHRRLLRQYVGITSTNDIHVISQPAFGTFDAPDLFTSPPELHDLDTCGPRKVRGIVIARWHGDSLLIQAGNDNTVAVRLRDTTLPELGATVEVVGKVTTDLYRHNLIQSQWRTIGKTHKPEKGCWPHDLRQIFYDASRRTINSYVHGKNIRIRGTLKSLLTDEAGRNRFLVEQDGFQMTVDCSALPGTVDGLQEGSEVSVTGIAVLDSENWHSGLVFPKVSGIFLVPRTAEDIRVLEPPPWWTPARLAAVVFGLLALLAAILVWNATLRVLVARKSRALLREQASKLEETLKIDERTRLAAELHDYLAQNLTVISYQISAAESALAIGSTDAADCLKTADRMLLSCRSDLRRCLWDLKSDALNESDFAKAIERMSEPVCGDARLFVRFAANRNRLNDSTAHAVLSICRELVSNAVRHGKARKVQIAGEVKDGAVRFSVRDDGLGFEPAKRPGQTEGHFGLDGVAERIRRFSGQLQIDSHPGRGTRVVVTLRPKEPQS